MRILSGTDIVDISRIDRSITRTGDAFINRCFTKSEQEYCDSLKGSRRMESYAARFAAKEAAGKALGTGIVNDGVSLTDIEVVRNEGSAPELVLHGRAREIAEDLHIVSISVSLSHDGGFAVAFCTMLAETP
ncbi:holo-[acyl-carrier protein] synthase [Ruminococcaceae bacterium YRB3002]|nr:holo-[acyl-carrier protein] synthase [Ruminococcaceae bacterium YRB3002]